MKLGQGLGALALASAMALAVNAPSSAATSDSGHHGHGPTVDASGLDNPRGLGWGAAGVLLVAEAGRGGPGPENCFAGVFTANRMCYGPTGAVTAITPHGQRRIVTGLPSIAEQGTGSFAFGPSDVSGRFGNVFISVGGPGPQLERPIADAAAAKLGTVQRVVGPRTDTVADLAAFELANDPDKQLHESNPTSVLTTGDKLYAIDAAGNTFFSVGPRGQLKLLKTFENRTANGATFQAVPTALAQGPDGAVYIADLTGATSTGFLSGQARVWRMGRDGAIKVYAEGFTTAVDLAFGPDGSLYVLEVNPGSAGRVVRAHPGGAPEVIIDTDANLSFPTGIAVGRDGSIYVTNCGNCQGAGTVLRFAA